MGTKELADPSVHLVYMQLRRSDNDRVIGVATRADAYRRLSDRVLTCKLVAPVGAVRWEQGVVHQALMKGVRYHDVQKWSQWVALADRRLEFKRLGESPCRPYPASGPEKAGDYNIRL